MRGLWAHPEINPLDNLNQSLFGKQAFVVSSDLLYRSILACGGENSPGGAALIELAIASGHIIDQSRFNHLTNLSNT